MDKMMIFYISLIVGPLVVLILSKIKRLIVRRRQSLREIRGTVKVQLQQGMPYRYLIVKLEGTARLRSDLKPGTYLDVKQFIDISVESNGIEVVFVDTSER